MKKQFENEIERVAPFRTELQDEIIRKSSKKKTFQYRIVLSGFVGLLAICALLFFGPFEWFESGRKTAKDNGIIYGENNDANKPLSEVLKYKLYGDTWQTNDEIQNFLMKTWNEIPWNPNAKVEKDSPNNYKIALQVRRAENAPIEELSFYLWDNGDSWLIDGDFGLGELKGDAVGTLSSLIWQSIELHDGERSKTDFDIVRYSIFGNEYVIEDEKSLANIQYVFDKIEWFPGVERQWEREPDVSMVMWIKLHGADVVQEKAIHFYIHMTEVAVTGALGEGRIPRDVYNDFITLLQEGAEQAFTLRTPVNETEREEFRWLVSEMTGDAPSHIGVASIFPQYALLVDGEVHYFWGNEETGEVTHIAQISLNYTNSKQHEAVLEKLKSYTKRDIQKLFEEVAWQEEKVSIEGQPILQFEWAGVNYDLWLNKSTRELTIWSHQNKWALLDENQSKQLALYLRELGYGDMEW